MPKRAKDLPNARHKSAEVPETARQLAAARKSLKLTRERAAALYGGNPHSLYRWEKGIRGISAEDYRRVMTAYESVSRSNGGLPLGIEAHSPGESRGTGPPSDDLPLARLVARPQIRAFLEAMVAVGKTAARLLEPPEPDETADASLYFRPAKPKRGSKRVSGE